MLQLAWSYWMHAMPSALGLTCPSLLVTFCLMQHCLCLQLTAWAYQWLQVVQISGYSSNAPLSISAVIVDGFGSTITKGTSEAETTLAQVCTRQCLHTCVLPQVLHGSAHPRACRLQFQRRPAICMHACYP